MRKAWDTKRLVSLIEMLLALLDATDLDDDAADEVCEILPSKLWQRSGQNPSRFTRR